MIFCDPPYLIGEFDRLENNVKVVGSRLVLPQCVTARVDTKNLPRSSEANMKRLPTPLIARIRVAAEERRVRI